MTEQAPKPLFLVCEDGTEYLERFERYLSDALAFDACPDFATLVARLTTERDVRGILLDLDFRRTKPDALVDEYGATVSTQHPANIVQCASHQGLCIVSALRRRGLREPVLLFADIDDAGQREFLTRQFAPLELVPSHVGLSELRSRLLGHTRT
jgi:hypothetical protein